MAGLRWGILSTARINDKILAASRASDGAEVVAVASRDKRVAEGYARDRGIARAYGSYESLLADPEIDAVYISLPNHLHVEWSIRALEAGKHVLCEKPLTRRLDDATRAFDVADRTGLVLSEAFMWRHNPQTRRLEELVAQGVIGSVRRIRAVFGFDLADAGRSSRRGLLGVAARTKGRVGRLSRRQDVRLVPAFDGGSLMDVGCYCVSAVRLLAGEPTLVTAEQTLGPSGVDVHFAAQLELPGGIHAEFESGLAMAARDELEVIGTDGSLFLDDPFLCVQPAIEHRDGAVERIELEPEDSYRLELENVSDAVAGRRPLLLGRRDALGQARALEALSRAADEVRPVKPADLQASRVPPMVVSPTGAGR